MPGALVWILNDSPRGSGQLPGFLPVSCDSVNALRGKPTVTRAPSRAFLVTGIWSLESQLSPGLLVSSNIDALVKPASLTFPAPLADKGPLPTTTYGQQGVSESE